MARARKPKAKPKKPKKPARARRAAKPRARPRLKQVEPDIEEEELELEEEIGESEELPPPDDDWAEAVVGRVLGDLHPKQRAFAVDPGRRVSALCARGAGKTTAGLARFVIRMVRTRKARCLFVAQTKEDARELIWEKLQEWTERLGIEATFVENRLECKFTRTGSVLKLVGADDDREVNKLRGKPRHEVGIDETASFTAKRLSLLIHRVIGPRLGDYGGCIWMVGTPGHMLSGLFYEATAPGQKKHRPWDDRSRPEYCRNEKGEPVTWSGWSSHAWDLEDGAPYVDAIAKLWAEALLDKLTEGWGDDHPIWMREYKGLWAADGTENIYKYEPNRNGQPWNEWDPFDGRELEGDLALRTAISKLPLGPDGKPYTDWLFGIGGDMGSKDPFALNVFAFRAADPKRMLWHVLCYGRTKMYGRLIAIVLVGEDAVERIMRGELIDYEKPGGGIFDIIGWPALFVVDLAHLGDAIAEDLAGTYGIPLEVAEKKGKYSAIALANGDFSDGRWKILKGSDLAKQLGSLQWVVDEFGQVKENKGVLNDHCDSMIYFRRGVSPLFSGEPPNMPGPGKGGKNAPRADDFEDMTTDGGPPDEFGGLLSEGSYEEDDWGNA